MEANDEMSTLVKSLNVQDDISLRDCYFGGSTNALTLHKEFHEDERVLCRFHKPVSCCDEVQKIYHRPSRKNHQ